MITLLELRPYTGDRVAPSPNHDARTSRVIEGIVLHATEDAGNEARALSWLRSPKSGASCHLLVTRAGRVVRLVGDRQRAWHAGGSRWRGKGEVNSRTLGIEIANRNDGEPYTDAQYDRVAAIVAHYCRQGLSPEDVVTHGEIDPGRKTDPFGWDRNRFLALVESRLRPARVPPDDVAPAPAPLAVAAAAPPGARWITEPVRPAPAIPAPGEPAIRPTPAITGPPSGRVPEPTRPKAMLRSRTLWLNGMAGAAAGGALVCDHLDLVFWVRLGLPEEVAMWILFVVSLANFVLRFWTDRPLDGRQPAPGLTA